MTPVTEFRSSAPQASTSGQGGPTPAAPQSIQSAVVQLVDPRETLTPMLEGLSRALGYRRAIVALYDPARGVLRGAVGLNVPDALVESIEIPLGEAESPMVIALREGVPVRVDDTNKLDDNLLGLLLEMEISSCAVVPLRSSSEQFGLATWQGRDVPAVGVVILSKDETISDADIERRAAHSAEWRAYSLADALLGGRQREATLGYLRLREQGERLQGLSYLIAQRLREGLAAALRLQSGAPAAQVRKGLRMPPRAAERFMADVARTDPARLRNALATLADLELDARGGPALAAARAGNGALDEDTLALRAIERICLRP